jgi:hypothetical protein
MSWSIAEIRGGGVPNGVLGVTFTTEPQRLRGRTERVFKGFVLEGLRSFPSLQRILVSV